MTRRQLAFAVVLQVDAASSVGAFAWGIAAQHVAELAALCSPLAAWSFACVAALRAARRAVRTLRAAVGVPADESTGGAP